MKTRLSAVACCSSVTIIVKESRRLEKAKVQERRVVHRNRWADTEKLQSHIGRRATVLRGRRIAVTEKTQRKYPSRWKRR